MDNLYFRKKQIVYIDLGTFNDEFITLIADYYSIKTFAVKQEIKEKLKGTKLFLPYVRPLGDNENWCGGYHFILKTLYDFAQNLAISDETPPLPKPDFMLFLLTQYRVVRPEPNIIWVNDQPTN